MTLVSYNLLLLDYKFNINNQKKQVFTNYNGQTSDKGNREAEKRIVIKLNNSKIIRFYVFQ